MKDNHMHREGEEGKPPAKLPGFKLTERKGRFELFARVDAMGPDLLVTLWGGAAHIGALGMAVPQGQPPGPSRKERHVLRIHLSRTQGGRDRETGFRSTLRQIEQEGGGRCGHSLG